MPEISYEVFEHTADIGLRAYGKTLPELFAHAAQGMESLMVSPEQARLRESREIRVEGHDLVSLLISWLNALIVLFDTDYLLFCHFDIHSFSETHLEARVYGETYDAGRHDLSSAMKAATWHQAAVESVNDG
jgi:SHS2 domain-containing protein